MKLIMENWKRYLNEGPTTACNKFEPGPARTACWFIRSIPDWKTLDYFQLEGALLRGWTIHDALLGPRHLKAPLPDIPLIMIQKFILDTTGLTKPAKNPVKEEKDYLRVEPEQFGHRLYMYGIPQCTVCEDAYKWLKKSGYSFTYISAYENDEMETLIPVGQWPGDSYAVAIKAFGKPPENFPKFAVAGKDVEAAQIDCSSGCELYDLRAMVKKYNIGMNV